MAKSNTLSTRLAAIGRGLIRSFRDFPVEAFICLAAFTLTILSNEEVIKPGFPLAYFFPLVVLSFCLHRQAGRGKAWKICYYVSALFWVPLCLVGTNLSEAGITAMYLISFILLFAADGRQDNEHYASTINHVLAKGASAVLVAAILSMAILAIIASVDSLFVQKHLAERWYIYPQLGIWMIVAPMLCCTFVAEPQGQWKDLRAHTIIVDFVLSPALLIYAVILYAYMLRILFQWQLPDGGVAYMVGGFVSVALICRLQQELITYRHFSWFYRAFPYIALGPLVLLWIGIARRVGDYGLTEMRIYLIAVSLLLTLFTLMLLWPRTRSFFLMGLITGSMAALLTFIPGISAYDLGNYSQRGREEADNPVEVTEPGSVTLEPTYYQLEGPVSLEGYTLLIPETTYHYYEDSSVAIFYEDDSRKKELLRCEIASRLESASEEIMVYKNDDYLAVFEAITDYHSPDGYPSFTTGRHTLYTRQPQQ